MGKEGEVNVFHGALEALVQDVTGPIGQFLVEVMRDEILPEAYNALSVPADVRPTTNTAREELRDRKKDQPDAPPRTNTGDLRESLEAVGPFIDERGICAYGIATATHGGFPYPRLLIQRGYKFLPEGDPRFIYVDVP